MNTPDTPVCPKCGSPLPADAPRGLCPPCLVALNFATETVVTGDGDSPATPPLLPEEIAPHFPQLEVLECLGRGGMGVVYKARQKSLGRLVALKLLAPEREKDPQFAERFAREAQALARLDHPHIVTVYDFGQTNGYFYLLMEFVDGVNLRQLLRARKLTPEEALAIVPPLCEALQFAHERGIVHRDIKPENLLLAKDGRVKIADFGIARMLGAGAQAHVAEDQAAGTPGYMAPEQKGSPARVDSRADIYSLGVVLYEMLTGELPARQIEPPSRKVHVDVRIDEIVLRALEKEPELRFQTAAEFRTKLEESTPAATPIPSRTWMKILGRILLVPGIPIGFFGLVLFWMVLQDSNWNPSYAEGVVVFGIWFAGLLLLGGSAVLLIKSRPERKRELPPVRPWRRAWLGQPKWRRQLVCGGIALAALGLFVCFAWPRYEIVTVGEATTATLAFGFPDPWLKEIKIFQPGGTQNWPEQRVGMLSFLAGIFGMGLWITLCLLREVEVSSGVPPRKRWLAIAFDLSLCAFALAHGGLLACAILPVQPLFMMALTVGFGTPVLARALLREPNSFPSNESGDAVTRRNGLAIAAVFLVPTLAALSYYAAITLARARKMPIPPAPAPVETPAVANPQQPPNR